jgi:hypothetical protein
LINIKLEEKEKEQMVYQKIDWTTTRFMQGAGGVPNVVLANRAQQLKKTKAYVDARRP